MDHRQELPDSDLQMFRFNQGTNTDILMSLSEKRGVSRPFCIESVGSELPKKTQ